MQKVVGSSPIIRSGKRLETGRCTYRLGPCGHDAFGLPQFGCSILRGVIARRIRSDPW